MEERYVQPNKLNISQASPIVPEMASNKANSPVTILPEMTPAKPNTENRPMIKAMPTVMLPEMTPAKPNVAVLQNIISHPNTEKEDMSKACGYKYGELPPCAPLAAGYVPFQQKNPPKYEKSEALTRGTLYPGLDLPFMNVANKTNPYAGTPMGELMALGFAIKEINLYLDTHPDDEEAIDMLVQLNRLMQAGQQKFVSLFGPQTILDITSGDTYPWLDNPWPWEYKETGAGENHV